VLEGDAQRALKNNDAALAAYKAALGKALPTDAAVRYHALLAATGKQAEADKFSAGWTRDQPKDAGFALYLADAALARRDWPAAELQYRRVIDLQPGNGVAINNLAWLLVKANKPGALALAEQANMLQPNQAAFMDTLAMALAAEKKLDQAIEVQKKALAIAPDSPVLKLGLARLYLQGGQKPQARELLEPLSQLGDKFQDHAEVKTLLSGL
jgi:predicted Zn-dependent protease